MGQTLTFTHPKTKQAVLQLSGGTMYAHFKLKNVIKHKRGTRCLGDKGRLPLKMEVLYCRISLYLISRLVVVHYLVLRPHFNTFAIAALLPRWQTD